MHDETTGHKTAELSLFYPQAAIHRIAEVKAHWLKVSSSVAPKDHTHTNQKDMGLVIKASFKGDHREAIAEGSVTGGGMEFTPGPSTSAEIQTNKTGALVLKVTKNNQ